MELGTRVRTNVSWPNAPKGTEGIVVEDYGTGITVAWNTTEKPLPKNMTPKEIGEMWAVNHNCPLRDGFDKETELHYLDEIEDEE